MEEVRNLLKHVKAKSGIDSEEIGTAEEVDVQDLVNVVMDVSLDVFGGKNATDSINAGGPARYSNDFMSKSPKESKDNDDKKLKKKVKELKEENEKNESKIEKL